MKKSLIILFLVPLFFTLNAQKLQYDIILFNNVIGKGDFNRTIQNGIEKIDLVTKASAKVMFKQKESFTEMDIIMKNGVLQSLNQTKIDDGEKQTIKIVKEGGQLFHYIDGEKSKVEKPIKYTSTHLFYEEPVNVKEAYVERLNTFVPIKKIDDNVYKTVVDGSANFYEYKNGKLVEYRIKNVINIYMKRV